MLCENCRWWGRPGFVPSGYVPQWRPDYQNPSKALAVLVWMPCPECQGSGITSCCDGACGNENDVARACANPQGDDCQTQARQPGRGQVSAVA